MAGTTGAAGLPPSGNHRAGDALVLFGVTGDLARKLLVPALYRLAERGVLTVPVVGVARADWDLDRLWTSLKQLYPIGVTVDDLVEESGGLEGLDKEFLEVQLKEDAHAAYNARDRSSMRSSGCSSPTDSRIVPSVMPASTRSSADMRKCVVDAG